MSQKKIGDSCKVFNQKGKIKFIGKTKFATGNWVGIELDNSVGRNSGSVDGIKYFECKENCGIFVRGSVLERKNKKNQFEEKEDPLLVETLNEHRYLVDQILTQKSTKLDQIHELEEKLKKQGRKGRQFLRVANQIQERRKKIDLLLRRTRHLELLQTQNKRSKQLLENPKDINTESNKPLLRQYIQKLKKKREQLDAKIKKDNNIVIGLIKKKNIKQLQIKDIQETDKLLKSKQ
eukprot:Anaeramoba_flamelloidesa344839_55.p1 GENE.a344839_55~~a344839_55.p1  ORF type:complete len:235 (-),score=74.34 a344839_55:103-807(-)